MLVADIRRAVAEHYGLTDADIVGRDPCLRYARPRQVAMYLATELTGNNRAHVGRHLRRDRSTVRHACQVIAERRAELAPDIFAILGRLPA